MTAPTRLIGLVQELTALPTRRRRANELTMELEHGLMRLTGGGGLRAAERAIAGLNARGRQLILAESHAGLRTWREELAGGRRMLQIRLAVTRAYRSASVRYQPVRPARLTPRQRTIHGLQQAFYARCMAVGQRAYRDPAYRASAPDRLLLLIGELEADVNNGGFDQYLGNKGRRRARAALAALRAVGARKTAAMLARALAPETSPAERAALDDRFYRVPEDLAVLAARHVGLRAAPSRPAPASTRPARRAR
jgi:hypothetical protein